MRTGKSLSDRSGKPGFLTLGTIVFSIFLATFHAMGFVSAPPSRCDDTTCLWKAGIGKRVITPTRALWMSGYAAREKPAQGTIHDLWVKTLAIEDAAGNRALWITCDIIGFSKKLADGIVRTLMQRHQLPRSAIALCSSHNHSGPVVNENLFHIYPPFDDTMTEAVRQYADVLQQAVVSSAEDALGDLTPVDLIKGRGIARFAVNRRENSAEDVLANAQLKGPYDHAVPVIAACTAPGMFKAIVFGYACHATTLNGCLWSGDYPGFAQLALEERYPGATALFFAGCAGDQNPIPRRSVALASQYGAELCAAVTGALEEPVGLLESGLWTSYREIALNYADPPTADSLVRVAGATESYQQRWAAGQLSLRHSTTTLPTEYSGYPVQAWRLGNTAIAFLGGEVVVDYALRLKEAWGHELVVAAYANNVMAYIPSERVLKEGGYEGLTSMCVYGHPSRWASGIEDTILEAVHEQIKSLGIAPAE